MQVRAYGFLDESRKIGGVPIPELIITVSGFILGLIFLHNILKSIIIAAIFFFAAKSFFAKNQKGFLQKSLFSKIPHISSSQYFLGSKYLEKLLVKRVFF